jgi:RNA-splicing ligase RtcB
MQHQLQKAINLSKKTGDRIIVFDGQKPDNIFVVMPLNDYENLVLGKSEVRGLTENELLDKINRDIAIWKSDQDYCESMDDDHCEDEDFFNDLEDSEDNEDNNDQNGDFGYQVESRPEISENKKKIWQIPSDRKKKAEEVIEEDRQYLEEIMF